MRGRFNITLSQALDEQLDHYAKEHDMTRSAIIESALKEFFKGTQNTQDAHIASVNNRVLHLAERMKVVEKTLAQILHTPEDHNINNQDISDNASQPIIENVSNSVPLIDHEKWYRHGDVVKMMPTSININTRKAKVSKAIANRALITNQKKGNELLILGSSIEKWLNTLFHDMGDK